MRPLTWKELLCNKGKTRIYLWFFLSLFLCMLYMWCNFCGTISWRQVNTKVFFFFFLFLRILGSVKRITSAVELLSWAVFMPFALLRSFSLLCSAPYWFLWFRETTIYIYSTQFTPDCVTNLLALFLVLHVNDSIYFNFANTTKKKLKMKTYFNLWRQKLFVSSDRKSPEFQVIKVQIQWMFH